MLNGRLGMRRCTGALCALQCNETAKFHVILSRSIHDPEQNPALRSICVFVPGPNPATSSGDKIPNENYPSEEHNYLLFKFQLCLPVK